MSCETKNLMEALICNLKLTFAVQSEKHPRAP